MASMSSCLSFRFLTNVTKTHHKRLNDFQVYHSSSSKSQGHSRALLRLPQENRTALRRILTNAQVDQGKDPQEDEDLVLRNVVWTGYATYMAWLLFLPYAPGDPVWAIKEETLKLLLDLSLNFFYILPILNSVGQSYMEAPVIHPTSEALFNFINAWSLMFGPLLVTDVKRRNWSGSVEALWSGQMFLTNIFLLPYMALRLGSKDTNLEENKSSGVGEKLGKALKAGSKAIGVTGLIIGTLSIFWFISGRPESGFGGISDRWHFFLDYLVSDRAAYAFLFDLLLYSIFQVWLIADNLRSEKSESLVERRELLHKLKFVPFFGLAAYLLLWPLERKNA